MVAVVLCVLLQHWIIRAVASSGSGELQSNSWRHLIELQAGFFKLCLLAAALLCRALVGLELDKFLGHIVIVALGEDAQHSEACFVHVDAFAQRQPAGYAAFGGHVLQLQDSHSHGAVLPGEAVILDTHLQLVALRTHLVAQGAAVKRRELYKHLLVVIFNNLKKKQPIGIIIITHKVKVSLYLGAQLLFFDLVAYFLFLSLR